MLKLAPLALALAACAAPTCPPPVTVAPPPPADETAIRAVLETFRTALIAKDTAALDRIMLGPDVPFRSTVIGSDKPPMVSTAGDFAKALAADTGKWEEQFSDVHIAVDGTLATLDAHYAFLANGVQTNDGREIWVLMHAGGAWKILSVTWSIRPAK